MEEFFRSLLGAAPSFQGIVAQLSADAAYDGAHGPHVAVGIQYPSQRMLVCQRTPRFRRKLHELPLCKEELLL